ncbi:hypothetical protein ACWF9G_18510 [Nocardia sp. NPDC055029]|uniref:hypothetical protein n=1 Tax=Nocardia sp. NPDC060259 TaxID=3347088 RepID=UPI00364818B8
MNATSLDLHRTVVLPVRAVRAGLGAAADEDPAVVARRTAKVAPALAAAAERVAEIRDTVAGSERDWGSAAADRHARKAMADTVARLDGYHGELASAAAALTR